MERYMFPRDFILKVTKVVERTWPLSDYTKVVYEDSHELVGLAFGKTIAT